MVKKNTIRLTESELRRVISESVKKCVKEASQENMDFYNNTENRLEARQSIADYANEMMETYSLSIEDLRFIMDTLNKYIQNHDSF